MILRSFWFIAVISEKTEWTKYLKAYTLQKKIKMIRLGLTLVLNQILVHHFLLERCYFNKLEYAEEELVSF